MFNWSFFVAVGFAFLDWASTWNGWKKRLYVAKPATMLFLIVWTIQLTRWQGDMLWFGLALCFSLLGDVALMLNKRFLMGGIGAFLLADIAYIIGFNQNPATLSLGVVLVFILILIIALRAFQLIAPGILQYTGNKIFLGSSLAYGITVLVMMLSALLTFYRPGWAVLPGLLAAMGGALFYISDITLTYDRFTRKLKHGQSYVHLTYHLGQFCIISGAILHYLR